MKDLLKNIIDWVISWDFMSILYSVIASIVFAIMLKWSGFFQWVRKRFQYKRITNAYRKALIRECSTLIVVGRRQGFTIDDVFIPLDLAPSNLMPEPKYETSSPRGSYVLVGGPGAGKSTIVKKRILERIRESDGLPFLIRLREYTGFESIEDYFVHKLRSIGFPDPELTLRSELSKKIVSAYWMV